MTAIDTMQTDGHAHACAEGGSTISLEHIDNVLSTNLLNLHTYGFLPHSNTRGAIQALLTFPECKEVSRLNEKLHELCEKVLEKVKLCINVMKWNIETGESLRLSDLRNKSRRAMLFAVALDIDISSLESDISKLPENERRIFSITD